LSLRTALATLPDDRETRHAVAEILAYFTERDGEAIEAERVVRVTGRSKSRVQEVLSALATGVVLDSLGNPPAYRYHHDSITDLEVTRLLRTTHTHAPRLQGSVDKFRSRYPGR
jgi:hypothetical protein